MMLKKQTLLLLAGVMLLLTPAYAGTPDAILTRETAPENYRWNTTAIYPTWEEWEKDLQKAEDLLAEMGTYQGRLNEDPGNLLALLSVNEDAGKIIAKLYCYPYLQRSVDTRNQDINTRFQEVLAFLSSFSSQTSWVTPELLTIPEEELRLWLSSNPGYEPYRFGIENALRMQQYVLDHEKEELLSYFSLSTSAPARIYTELSTSDMNFPEVTLSTGETLAASHANLGKVLSFNTNQNDRRLIWEAHLSAFEKNANTYAAILNAVYQGDWAYARSKNFESYLQYSLLGDNIPEEVYHNLINTARNNTTALQHYIDLRQRALKLETYNSWDGSVSLSEFSKQYSWEEACELVKDALAPLGADYSRRLEHMLEGGWIDVYEGESKTSNPYSMNVYGVNPFILMNWDGTLRDVFTLAHELGHALHSMYSSEDQPFSTHRYSTFVAEVASIFNEELLLDHMLKNSTDPLERIALLDQAISNLSGTFYRQSMLADFEYRIRSMVEQGRPVNLASLKNLMSELNQSYYGDKINAHPYSDITWARVMHFFQLKYYVFQYATSYAASSHLFNQITGSAPQQRNQALHKYQNLLKSGGSDYPINLLKEAGVDMSRPETLEAVVHRLENLVEQLETELMAAKMI